MRRTMPPAAEVRDALDRIVASGVFARSERARDLLRYVIEQDLAGNADRLKGYSIAIDVFGKGEAFDPANDTVVRVQAGRLRDLLDQYYAHEGRDDPLRIAIPRGSYVPAYSGAPAQDEAEAEEAERPVETDDTVDRPAARGSVAAGSKWLASASRPLAIGIAIAAVLVLATSYNLVRPIPQVGDRVAAGAVGYGDLTGTVVQNLLPTVSMQVEDTGEGVERVAGTIRRGLTGFDTITVIGRTPAASASPPRPTAFVFVVRDGAPGEVYVELQNLATGKVLLSRSIATDGATQPQIDDAVADVLTTVAPVSGVIYASLAAAGSQGALIHCLIANDLYYREQGPEAHRRAYRCLEELLEAGLKSVHVYSELASLHVQAIVGSYDYPRNPDYEQALELARMGVQLGPDSPYAHRSMGYVLSRFASAEESLRWMRKAYELNTFDLGMAASYGYAQIFSGAYVEGTPILGRAVAAASAHPTWWDYGLFLGHYMLGDFQKAADAVSVLASSERVHYLAARLLAADALNRREEATRLLNTLHDMDSSFAADPHAFYLRGKYPEDMCERLVSGLREAGLAGAS